MLQNKRQTFIVIIAAPALIGCFLLGRSLGSADAFDRHLFQNQLRTLITASSAAIGGAGSAEAGQGTLPPEVMYEEILEAVKTKYVEENINEPRLSNRSMSQMLASLDDPKTNYLDIKMRQMRQSALQGKFTGIGAVVQYTKTKKGKVDYRNLTVVAVMPNSPAERAGLKTGDNVTFIDGRWVITYPISADIETLVIDKSLTDAQKREAAKKIVERYRTGYTLPKALIQLTTGTGKELKLKVERQNSSLDINVTTADTEVTPVEQKQLAGDIGYLRVLQFNSYATTQFQQALEKFKDAKGLILDLRQNAGGVTAEKETGVDGYQSAKTLIASLAGSVNTKLERKPNQTEPLSIEGTGAKFKAPIIVLVDKGTANLAEFVANVLHDSKQAKIIGTRTFGDPILQLLTIFKNGTGVEMTTAHLLMANGQQWLNGLQPDVVAEDNPLEKAISTLGG